MRNYYYATTLLPDLVLGEKPELAHSEFIELVKINLSRSDMAKTQTIARLIDLENLRAFWHRQSIDPHGNFGWAELEDVLLAQELDLPSYLVDYLDRFPSTEERISHFPLLMARFFQVEEAQATGLLKKYLTFERRLRLVLVGFRAKQLGRNVVEELQYEDPQDETVAQIVAQKDSKSYDPPDGFEDLKPVFERYARQPLELQRALISYRLDKILAMTENSLFTIDRILAYQASLILVDKWNELDRNAGGKIIESLLKDIPR